MNNDNEVYNQVFEIFDVENILNVFKLLYLGEVRQIRKWEEAMNGFCGLE